MFLSDPNGGHGGEARNPLPEPVASPKPNPTMLTFIDRAIADHKNSPRLWALLFVLALGLHILLAQWLSRPELTETKPLPPRPIEVALVVPEAPKPIVQAAPQVAPVQPTPPPPPPPPKKVEPPKPKPAPPKPAPPKPAPPKPVVKKVVKPPEPKLEPIRRRPEPEPEEREAPEPPAAREPVRSPAPPAERPVVREHAPAPTPKAPVEAPVTQASFNAAYLHNPRPAYPAMARQRGWEGVVKLRVRVSAAGSPEQVSVEQSSGHDLLDETALETVREWKFAPAKRGDTPIASVVIVPLTFRLSK